MLNSQKFSELEQNISKFVWRCKRPRIAEAILRKENGAEEIRLQEFRATIIKTVWYWHKSRNIDQWNKIESPEINTCTYEYLIFEEAKTASSINCAGKTGQLHVKE